MALEVFLMLAKYFNKKNLTIILLSVFLAIILWLFVVGDTLFQVLPKRKILEEVPLVYINLEEGLEVSEIPESVSVVLEGLPENLQDKGPENLVAFIDLKDKKNGDHKVEIKINPPEGLSVISFLPAGAEIKIRHQK